MNDIKNISTKTKDELELAKNYKLLYFKCHHQ